jgi:hypothetical protein
MKKFYSFLIVPYLVGSAVLGMDDGEGDPPLPPLHRSHRVGDPLDIGSFSQESTGSIPASQYGPAYNAWQARHPAPAPDDDLARVPTVPYVPPRQSPPGGSQGTA